MVRVFLCTLLGACVLSLIDTKWCCSCCRRSGGWHRRLAWVRRSSAARSKNCENWWNSEVWTPWLAFNSSMAEYWNSVVDSTLHPPKVHCSRAAKFKATHESPSNCDSTDYSQFSLVGRVTPNASSPRVLSRMSWFINTMFTRIVDPVPSFQRRWQRILWHHEYDDIESRDVVNDVTNRRAVGTFI